MMRLLKIIGLPGLIISYLVVFPILIYKARSLLKQDMSILDVIDYFLEEIPTINEVLNHGTIIFSVLFYIYIYWLIF